MHGTRTVGEAHAVFVFEPDPRVESEAAILCPLAFTPVTGVSVARARGKYVSKKLPASPPGRIEIVAI